MTIKLNLRETLAHVTDGAGATFFDLANDTYPTTRNNVTFGASGSFRGTRNRQAPADPRWSGYGFAHSDFQTVIQILLPDGPGVYPLRTGSADLDYGSVGGGTIRIRDGVGGDVLHVLDGTPAYTTEQVHDLDGVVHALADWDANSVPQLLTFTGDRLVIELNESDGSDGVETKISHIEIGDAITTLSVRKGSQFNVETALSGNVTAATLNGNAITVDSQAGNTITLTDSGSGITTSGEYDLVLTDDSADPDEAITVQVNVYGIVPSNNPFQKAGSPLVSLTDVQIRVTDGTALDGTQRYYSGSAVTDASGNLATLDITDSAAVDGDSVLLHVLTAAGDSIIAPETVELL